MHMQIGLSLFQVAALPIACFWVPDCHSSPREGNATSDGKQGAEKIFKVSNLFRMSPAMTLLASLSIFCE